MTSVKMVEKVTPKSAHLETQWKNWQELLESTFIKLKTNKKLAVISGVLILEK